MVYVVILHLDPDRESQMAHLLQNRASIPVKQVTKPVKVEPDHAYVIPPGQELSMVDGTIQLSDREPGQHAPIDLFFTTLGDAYGPASVAVVMSGTGSDGSVGLRRLKEAGGITIAQKPEEAEYDSMPRSAMATGQVDMVLAAGEMPGEIIRIQRSNTELPTGAEAESPPATDEAILRQIFGRLRGKTGHDFSDYKRSTVLRRIDRRLRFNRLTTLADYLERLREDPGEIDALFRDLLISVSSFFRDADAFEMVEREVIPKLFEHKGPEDQVRVWVAGCATGEEVYSLAMLLCDHASTIADPPDIQLFASDIDEKACAHAREGVYPETIVEDVSTQRLERFFDRENGGYRVKKPVRKLVLFASHDLLKDPPFSRLDLVSCRNVLIYLDPDAQQRVIESFCYALRPEGFLFLGTSESADDRELFVPIGPKQRIYRRGAVSHAVIPRLSVGRARRRSVDPAPGSREAESNSGVSYGDLHQRLLEAYAPPSLVVNEDGEIVHLSDRAGHFLRLAGGEPTRSLIDGGNLFVRARRARGGERGRQMV